MQTSEKCLSEITVLTVFKTYLFRFRLLIHRILQKKQQQIFMII